jgi:uncharacterized membrane protein YjjB (DUF3815 family)
LSALGRRVEAIGYLLPTICSFLVSLIVFTFNNHWHVGVDSLRALAAPLATFLPGAAITLAVIELSTHHVVSGASRLVAGFLQIAQLAFGILIDAQVAGIAETNLVTIEINRLGAWAPLLGVLVYGLGAMLYFGPPTSFLPWMMLLPGFWLLVPGSLGFMGVTQLLGTHSTAVFTATLIAMMSIAVDVQSGLLLWRAAIQLTSSPNRRVMHD